MTSTGDLSNTLNNASITCNTATEAINDVKPLVIDTINNVNSFVNDTSDNADNLFANANTFISSTDEKLDKISNKVNNFIDKQQEEIEKTEKLLQIVLIALAFLIVVGIIALIGNSIAKSRRQNRQNEILEQISNNIKNGNANYNTTVDKNPCIQ